jgi:hypothetical protein
VLNTLNLSITLVTTGNDEAIRSEMLDTGDFCITPRKGSIQDFEARLAEQRLDPFFSLTPCNKDRPFR